MGRSQRRRSGTTASITTVSSAKTIQVTQFRACATSGHGARRSDSWITTSGTVSIAATTTGHSKRSWIRCARAWRGSTDCEASVLTAPILPVVPDAPAAAAGAASRPPPERLPGIEPERKPSVSLARNQFVALVVGVCVLSAAIGSGIALLAQTGPEGPAGKQGKRGPEGPRGPAGESAAGEVEPLEAEIEELRGQLAEVESSAGEGDGELEERVESLEEEVSELGRVASELCSESEFEFLC